MNRAWFDRCYGHLLDGAPITPDPRLRSLYECDEGVNKGKPGPCPDGQASQSSTPSGSSGDDGYQVVKKEGKFGQTNFHLIDKDGKTVSIGDESKVRGDLDYLRKPKKTAQPKSDEEEPSGPAPEATGNFASLTKTYPKESSPSLTATESDAVRRFTAGAFRPLNDALRSGVGLDDDSKAIDAELGKAMAKIPVFKEPVMVRRGVNVTKSVLQQLGDAKPGEEMTFPAWTSTTNKPGTFRGNVEFRIAAKHGMDVKGGGAGDESTQKESELLLPRGAKFKVHSVKKSGGKMLINLEQIV